MDIPQDISADRRGHKPRERRCLASGEAKDPAGMIRFVLSPDHVVVPDIAGKLPGRGVWVSAASEALAKAIKTGAFAPGFKSKAIVPAELEDHVLSGLKRSVLGLVGMAKKSGQLIIGFDQVHGAARDDALAWRIEAKDGSEDGRGKIRTLSKAVARELDKPLPRVLGCFTAAEIGTVLGRDELTHAALPHGPLSRRLDEFASKLSGFEALIPVDWPDCDHEYRGLPASSKPS